MTNYIFINDEHSTVLIRNCICYGAGSRVSSDNSGIRCANSALVTCYNNTIIGGYYSFRQIAGVLKCINNIASGAVQGCFFGTFTNSNYNASSDATNTGGANDRISQAFTFVGKGIEGLDYHLTILDAGARTFGVSLSTDGSYPFSTDIDQAVRGSIWDIGADQITSSGVPTQFLHYRGLRCF
jgi:hypothetical protein